MSYYRYTGVQEGKKVTGKIQAATVDEASQRLKRMGISVEKFNDDAEIAPVINSAATPASVEKDWQSFLPPHARTEQVSRPIPAVQSAAAVAVPQAPAPVASVSVPPSIEAQTRVSDTIGAMAKAVHKEMRPRRKHSYLFGDAETMNQRVDDLLARGNGEVIHMAMSPDVHGKLRLAMVVEHDVLETKR